MNDDLKVAVEWLRGVSSIGNPESPTPVAALLAHLDDEQARQDAAVAAATKPLADRIAELEYERAGHVLVSFSTYDVLSRAERDRDALRASWREAVEVAERNAIDCVHLRHSAIALTAERDGLANSLSGAMATLAAVNSAVGATAGEEPSLVRAVQLVVAERDALGDSLEGCHDALEGAEADNDALRVEVDDLRSTCAMLRAQVEAARAVCAWLKRKGHGGEAAPAVLKAMDEARP